jgi:hypothetical protein
MKAKFLLIASLLNGAIFACNDHLFHLALNQRSYYNPAALCPYCKGSPFFSTGISFMPGNNNGFGNYYAFGNDGPNNIHGPWDLAYSFTHSPGSYTTAIGYRYAYAVEVGNWKMAMGFRESFYSIHQTIAVEGEAKQNYRARVFDTDGGIMLTNTKGIYAGISVLHFTSPQKRLTNENGTSLTLGTQVTMSVMGGYVQKLNKKWDLLPDVSMLKNKTETVAETGTMIRYNHHLAVGGGMTLSTDDKPNYEIRGGYMSSTFKWLFSASPSTQGWNVETGIVYRIQSGPCDGTGRGRGGSCNAGASPKVRPHAKKEKVTDNDDFVKHR